jgi:hypothetical protein
LPIDCAVRPDEGQVIFTVRGGFTADEFIEAVEAASELPGWRPAMDALFDMTDGLGNQLSPDALKRMARFMWASTPKLGAGYKVAVVAARDVEYGLSRMFQVFMDGPPFEFRIFRDRAEALEWLG